MVDLARLRQLGRFDALTNDNHSIESPVDEQYNCIAYAFYGDQADCWMWPHEEATWPEGIRREYDTESLVELFRSTGYDVCDSGQLEDGYEKIAIYENLGKPTHAARQLPSGRWASKLGDLEDIEHARAEDVEGRLYVKVALYMRRPRGSRP
jgi:hypothetical protein